MSCAEELLLPRQKMAEEAGSEQREKVKSQQTSLSHPGWLVWKVHPYIFSICPLIS